MEARRVPQVAWREPPRTPDNAAAASIPQATRRFRVWSILRSPPTCSRSRGSAAGRPPFVASSISQKFNTMFPSASPLQSLRVREQAQPIPPDLATNAEPGPELSQDTVMSRVPEAIGRRLPCGRRRRHSLGVFRSLNIDPHSCSDIEARDGHEPVADSKRPHRNTRCSELFGGDARPDRLTSAAGDLAIGAARPALTTDLNGT